MSAAYVTLVTSDDYGVGALVLAHSIRDQGTTRKLACMVTPSVSALMAGRLNDIFDEIITVDTIHSNSLANLHVLGRPDLLQTFTKFHLWTLEQYEKVVFMDADTLALANIDELFECDEFSACADIGWPDCFNSGVFVARPSNQTFERLVEFSMQTESFDGGDQGLLNDFFPDWKRIPFTFNVTPSASYGYSPAFRKYKDQMKVVHFIGFDKPWRWERFSDGTVVSASHGHSSKDLAELVTLWWKVYDLHIGRSSIGSETQGGFTPLAMSKHYLQFSSQPPNAVNMPGGGSSSSGASGQQASAEQQANPFFKSRYDWDHEELGLQGEGGKEKLKADEDDEDEHGARKLPLKKGVSVPSSPAKTPNVTAVKPAGPPRATPSSSAAKSKK